MDGFSYESVSKYTGLTIAQVQALCNEKLKPIPIDPNLLAERKLAADRYAYDASYVLPPPSASKIAEINRIYNGFTSASTQADLDAKILLVYSAEELHAARPEFSVSDLKNAQKIALNKALTVAQTQGSDLTPSTAKTDYEKLT